MRPMVAVAFTDASVTDLDTVDIDSSAPEGSPLQVPSFAQAFLFPLLSSFLTVSSIASFRSPSS